MRRPLRGVFRSRHLGVEESFALEALCRGVLGAAFRQRPGLPLPDLIRNPISDPIAAPVDVSIAGFLERPEAPVSIRPVSRLHWFGDHLAQRGERPTRSRGCPSSRCRLSRWVMPSMTLPCPTQTRPGTIRTPVSHSPRCARWRAGHPAERAFVPFSCTRLGGRRSPRAVSTCGGVARIALGRWALRRSLHRMPTVARGEPANIRSVSTSRRTRRGGTRDWPRCCGPTGCFTWPGRCGCVRRRGLDAPLSTRARRSPRRVAFIAAVPCSTDVVVAPRRPRVFARVTGARVGAIFQFGREGTERSATCPEAARTGAGRPVKGFLTLRGARDAWDGAGPRVARREPPRHAEAARLTAPVCDTRWRAHRRTRSSGNRCAT